MLKPLFLIGFFISCIPNSSCLFNDTIGAGDLLKRVVERLNGIRVTNTSEACSQAYERFREFSADFQALHKYEVPPPELLEIPPPEWKSERKLYLERSRIGTVYVEIDGAVSQILQELKFHQERSKYSGIKRFPRVIDEFLAGLRSMITPLRDVDFWEDGYFYLMARRQRNNTQCGEDHNLQNFLIKIYKMVVLTEIEAHAISALTYACQYGPLETNVRSSGYMDERRRNLPRHLNKQLVAYSKALSKSLEVISPSYFRYCDSTYNSWIQDVSFFELDGFLQSVILRYESRSCNANCWDIWDKNACPREWIDKRTGCNGQVTACAWLGDVRACALAHGPHKYKWVDSSVHGMLGNNSDSCPQGQGYYIGTEPRAGHNAESGCNCDCLENKWKVYLGPLESRESDNYVIVGVRFRVKNHMLFLQPAQGKLHPNGYIVDYEWVDLPNVIHSEYIGNIDLIHRSFFLDDLQLKPGHALTGIQFHGAQRGNSAQFKGFEISISGRPLDYETGKLDLTLANKYVDRGPRSNIEKELIYQRVRPVDEEIFNRLELSSQEFTYVTLHHSKLNDDFGQSTLPLFDSTPVLMKTHSPLAGISILHKGSKHNSGFFSVQVRPMSYSPFLGELIRAYERNATTY